MSAATPKPQPVVRVPAEFDAEFPDCSRLATEVFINIGVLVGTVQALVERLVAAEGLPSAAAFNVLSVLGGDPGPLRPSEIAERMLVSRATITGLLDTLEKRRLIRRTRSQVDGRSMQVRLTAQGRRLVDRMVPAMHRFERDLMGTLSDQELQRLLAAVSVLQARVGSMDPTIPIGIR